ncbi:MAG: putative Phosphoribosyltransferase [Candidatus Saccharibacteria bacterium]|nr:putative Phosphoribosyltransferase [Candidatus Saccharibacteria bacterium]
MIDTLLSFVAPHHCSGCAQIGSLLCDNCKYDITQEPYGACCACGKGLVTAKGLCGSCRVPYERAWCVADRRDQLQRLIGNYKFTNTRAAYRPLADLLHAHLPELPSNVVIVPVPTVNSHIRQRGYDHMLLVANRLAKLRGISVATDLQRATNTKQRAAGRAQRIKQAKKAFMCQKSLDPSLIYLLIDDVITTGSTVKYASQTLIDAGAQTVWVASISRQPLETSEF